MSSTLLLMSWCSSCCTVFWWLSRVFSNARTPTIASAALCLDLPVHKNKYDRLSNKIQKITYELSALSDELSGLPTPLGGCPHQTQDPSGHPEPPVSSSGKSSTSALTIAPMHPETWEPSSALVHPVQITAGDTKEKTFSTSQHVPYTRNSKHWNQMFQGTP